MKTKTETIHFIFMTLFTSLLILQGLYLFFTFYCATQIDRQIQRRRNIYEQCTKEWSKVARLQQSGIQGLNNCQIWKIFTASSIELIWALFLDTPRSLTAPQILAELTTTTTAPQNNFLEQFLFLKAYHCNFYKKCRHTW